MSVGDKIYTVPKGCSESTQEELPSMAVMLNEVLAFKVVTADVFARNDNQRLLQDRYVLKTFVLGQFRQNRTS